jgi:hypothetical protein
VQLSLCKLWRFILCRVICHSSFFLVLDRCSFSVSSPGSFIPDAHWTVSCLGSISYLHDLDKRKTFCACQEPNQGCSVLLISAPTIVTWTRLCFTLTSSLSLFFSNMLNRQLIGDLNIPHTHKQQTAVMYTVSV